MGTVEKDKAALISGIEADARIEEKEIIKGAEKKAAEKRKYSEKKIESILKDAGEKGLEQAKEVKKKIISSVEFEIKRSSLRVRGTVLDEIMNRVEKKLKSMTGDKKYSTVLANWITEAVIGLDAEAAEVNASEVERKLISNEMLSEISQERHKQTGRKISLKLSDSEPLSAQGIVLTAADGNTAFNNQVKTRMLRKQREIQKLIYDNLFTEDRKE